MYFYQHQNKIIILFEVDPRLYFIFLLINKDLEHHFKPLHVTSKTFQKYIYILFFYFTT